MKSLFRRKRKPVIGLDVSTTSIKLLELSETNGRYRIESYAVVPLPANAVMENTIRDLEAVSDGIAKAAAKAKTKVLDSVIAVAGSSVITKVVDMPSNLSEAQMEEEINHDAESYIPFPIEDVSLDFEVLGPVADNPDRVDVLLVACRREEVETRIEAIEMANLKARIVDTEAFAMERAFEFIAPQIEGHDENSVVAIMDIGASVSTLSVLKGGTTVYSRENLFGGKQLTEEIQRRYGLSLEEAGLAKKQGGLPEDYQDQVLKPFMDAVVQQIVRSLQFFFSSAQFNEVDHLVLAGGVASMPGLPELIAGQLGTPCTVANPFANMGVSSKVNAMALSNDAPALMIACGLAMRSFV